MSNAVIDLHYIQELESVEYKVVLPAWFNMQTQELNCEVNDLTLAELLKPKYSGAYSEMEWFYSLLEYVNIKELISLELSEYIDFNSNRDHGYQGNARIIRVK